MASGRTGWDGPTEAFDPDGDVREVYEHFDPLIGESRATATALPQSGNWDGRTIAVADTGYVYVWLGTSWKRQLAGLTGVIVKRGLTNVTTNSNGDASINMPTAFPSTILNAVLVDANTNMGLGIISIRWNQSKSDQSVIAFRLIGGDSNPLPNFPTRISWIAFGQ